jgi:hypothetical protein
LDKSLARFSALFADFTDEDKLFLTDNESLPESLNLLDPVVPISTIVLNCSRRTPDGFSSAPIDEFPSLAVQQTTVEEEQQIHTMLDRYDPPLIDGSDQGAIDDSSSDLVPTKPTPVSVVVPAQFVLARATPPWYEPRELP